MAVELFSAGLGLAGSIYGANKQAKAQAAALAQQQYEFERNREMQGANIAIALDDRRLQQEENAYQRAMERINRRKAGDERRYQMSEFEAYQDRLLAEWREVIERQILQDKEAARKAQFELEQYLQNRDLAQEERDEAIEALRQAQEAAECAQRIARSLSAWKLAQRDSRQISEGRSLRGFRPPCLGQKRTGRGGALAC